MYEFSYDYVKPRYDENVRLWKDVIWIQTKSLYTSKQILQKMFKSRLDHSLKEKLFKQVIGLMKDEPGEKIMIKIVGLRSKTYS